MCVLRVSGAQLDVDGCLASVGLEPLRVYRAGEPRRATRPDGPRNQQSGFNVEVSAAEMDDLAGQIRDACDFLRAHQAALSTLSGWPGVEDLRLDFGVELRIGRNDVETQLGYFPPRLLRLASALGLGLELSIYPGPV